MPATVLIIDDMKSIRDVITAMATSAGMEVCGTAQNGVAGVSLAKAQQPDVVVLDQEMPLQDGISVLPLIVEAAPQAKVVMFSSADDSSLIDVALARGAVAYFTKGDIWGLMQFLEEQGDPAA